MRNSIAAWYEVDGLRAKLWIADRENNRWGAVMWWDHVPPRAAAPPNRAAELIGRPPTHGHSSPWLAPPRESLVNPDHHQYSHSLVGVSMHDYVVVDAFTSRPLDGNPVAVFFDCEDLTTHLMQRIANEMHLSETTFVLPPQSGSGAHIRIFTPVNELPFAGHPMLGTAVALAEKLGQDKLQLETAIGVIPFRLGTDDGATEVWMQQPLPRWELYEHGPELLGGARRGDLDRTGGGLSERTAARVRRAAGHSRALRPAPGPRLARFPDMAVNCFAGAGARWRIRMFSPAYGVVEDAATGSAAGSRPPGPTRSGGMGAGHRDRTGNRTGAPFADAGRRLVTASRSRP